jgi:hypothetical protein
LTLSISTKPIPEPATYIEFMFGFICLWTFRRRHCRP